MITDIEKCGIESRIDILKVKVSLNYSQNTCWIPGKMPKGYKINLIPLKYLPFPQPFSFNV